MTAHANHLLPSLPTHWHVTPIRYSSKCLDGKRVPLNVEERSMRRGDYPYWGANGIVDTVDDYIFDEPLVLLGEDGAPFFDKTKPVAFFVSGKIWVNNHIHVLILAPGFDPRFVAYCLNTTDYGPWVEGSTRDKLTQDKMGSITLPTPPPLEQPAIADYLDRETAQLDALAAAKERLLDLVVEKRRAIITQAVTRGRDPRVSLVDSGVSWLGQIPQKWQVTRVRFLADVRTGLTIGKEYGLAMLRDFAYLRVANVQDGYLDLSEVTTVAVPESEAASCLLRSGDVLMNEGGDADKLGRGCVWNSEITPCLHQNHVFCVRLHNMNPHWLALWTASQLAKNYFENRAKRTTNLASISATNIKELPVPVPPPEEQRSILEFVAKESARLDRLRLSTQKTLDLLKERRAALITAAVTGRLNIPEAAA